MTTQLTEETFLSDMKDHSIEILQDDGVYRHLKISNGGSQIMGYHITTWPGHLCISGDMGTYVFARTQDMFKFFRPTILNPKIVKRRPLEINAPYWGEKLSAISNPEGFKKFSPTVFTKAVYDFLDQWEFESDDKEALVRKGVEEEIILWADWAHGTEEDAMDAVSNFSCENFEFTDFWETEVKEFTYHYLWCLYAIVYGIQQYDTEKIR